MNLKLLYSHKCRGRVLLTERCHIIFWFCMFNKILPWSGGRKGSEVVPRRQHACARRNWHLLFSSAPTWHGGEICLKRYSMYITFEFWGLYILTTFVYLLNGKFRCACARLMSAIKTRLQQRNHCTLRMRLSKNFGKNVQYCFLFFLQHL